MRIGIWCDYGFTLEPSEGIGVFVDNLARGIIRADSQCTLTMMAHAGEEEKLAPIVARGDGRIQVVSVQRPTRLRRFSTRWLKTLRRVIKSRQHDSLGDSALVHFIDQRIEGLNRSHQREISQHIEACDVWLLPYVGLEQDFSRPTVVAIHDLVCYHFPDMLTVTKLERLKRVVNRVSSRATIAACMSEYIRDNDLLGVLELPPSRVRVVKAAVPDDLCMSVTPQNHLAIEVALSDRGVTLGLPYLFYPAAFRSYKNHACLIQTLRELKVRSATDWKLVFTGIQKLPNELTQQIQQLHLEEDVLALGKVSRAELEYLYRHAFATVVPSLYEQGSFPVMEALHCQCPVAASNIPSLVEQFGAMGDSMLFFDPHDCSTLVALIEEIQADRSRVIERQQRGFQMMCRYTWDDSAKEWLSVLREASMLGSSIEQIRQRRLAA